MSVVTNVVVHCFLRESESIDSLQMWLDVNAGGQQLVEIGKFAGGSKCMEQELWAAGFNYFPLDDFLKFAAKVKWTDRDCVQIFVCGQEECLFTERFAHETSRQS